MKEDLAGESAQNVSNLSSLNLEQVSQRITVIARTVIAKVTAPIFTHQSNWSTLVA
jgi:hypothetical protein